MVTLLSNRQLGRIVLKDFCVFIQFQRIDDDVITVCTSFEKVKDINLSFVRSVISYTETSTDSMPACCGLALMKTGMRKTW